MKKSTKTLLICGILIPIIYIGTDTLSAILYPGYIYSDQAISELSAIGAPTAWLWKALAFIYNPLLLALGIGVRSSAKDNKLLKASGTLMVVSFFVGLLWLFFPMNMRGNIGSTSDTGHLVLSTVVPILLIAIVALGAGAGGKKFRLYSYLTVLAMLVFAALVWTFVPKVAANLPTPGMGLMERVAVFAPMIWFGVLAVVLLKKEGKTENS
jgi:hypothetical membrane protein